ncbi:MAG: energy transducer TonB [Chitinophagales bacterium]
MKQLKQILPLMLSVSMLSTSPVYFSCKNSATTNSSDSTDTAASSMPAGTNDSAMTKMVVESPKPLKGKATTKAEVPDKTQKISEDKNHIYNYSDVMPEFPGGEAALENYILTHINYPRRALDDEKEGTVIVHFAIDEHGKVMDAQVQSEPLGFGLEEEALRVVSTMPDWTPGKVNGEKAKVYYTLPIVYAMEK